MSLLDLLYFFWDDFLIRFLLVTGEVILKVVTLGRHRIRWSRSLYDHFPLLSTILGLVFWIVVLTSWL